MIRAPSIFLQDYQGWVIRIYRECATNSYSSGYIGYAASCEITAMRLTLRTLLAYRDRVLGPADMHDLHQRIQKNSDAVGLLNRIAALTGQVGSQAGLKVASRATPLDANLIAEYLDDSLNVEHVPELEKTCLESDTHLSELAHCHELVVAAMRNQVSVPASLRERALAIGDTQQRTAVESTLLTRSSSKRHNHRINRVDGSHGEVSPEAEGEAEQRDATRVGVSSPMMASSGGSIRSQGLDLEQTKLTHEVPEYLVGKHRYLWRMPTVIAALLVLFAVLIWQAIGSFSSLDELFVAATSTATPEQAAVPASERRTAEGATGEDIAGDEQPATEPASDRESDASSQAASQTPPDATGRAPAEPGDRAESDVSPPPPETPSESDAAGPGADQADKAVGGIPPDASEPSGGSDDSLAERTAASNGRGEGLELEPGGDEPLMDLPASPLDDEVSTARPLTAEWIPAAAGESQADVLLAVDGGKLVRPEPATALPLESPLIVPPHMQSKIGFANRVQVVGCGPSRFQIQAVDSEQATLRSSHCHLLVRGPEATENADATAPGSLLVVDTPIGEFEIEFLQPASMVSVEVNHRVANRGAVIDSSSFFPVVVLICGEGMVRVKQRASAPEVDAEFDVEIGQGVYAIADRALQDFRLQQIPNWFRPDAGRAVDRLAARDIDQALVPSNDDDMLDHLQRLAQSPRPETAALVVQTEILLGRWERLFPLLSDPVYRSHWETTLDLARRHLASQPSDVDRLQAVLDPPLGDDAAVLLGLILGDQESAWQADGLGPLVRHLEHPQLAVRVVANYQLQRLTERPTYFLPHDPDRAIVQQLRRSVSRKQFVMTEPPAVIWERARP